MLRELITDAFRNLLRKRGCSLLTVCGIAVGVMMVAAVSVLGNVGKTAVNSELDRMGINGLSVTAQNNSMVLDERALGEIRSLNGITSAMPLMLRYTDISLLSRTYDAVLCGIDAGADQVISLQVQYGRMISSGDINGAARVCVLDESVAAAAYGRRNIVGKTVDVRIGDSTQELTVVGITETGSSLLQNLTAFIPGMVYLPYTTQQNLTGQENFDQIAIRSADTQQAEEQVSKLLNRLYDGNTAFRTEDLASQKGRLTRVVELVALLLTALSGVSLLVSGFGIMTAMISAVKERRREIGIKKAIGATSARILLEFLAEALILSLLGGLLGVLPAAVLALILGTTVPAGWLLLFATLVGGVFGIYPALTASRLQPVIALRSE